ncbi:MAG: hypothetical protein A3205_02125 [Methanomassiliicoccales archaeon Mx-03]|nr:MAG: hypothetical protein A3205_02125 [Methanomassiliicoccales archaeon Mx-03]
MGVVLREPALADDEPVQDDTADDTDRREHADGPEEVEGQRDDPPHVSGGDDVAEPDGPQGLHHVVERVRPVQVGQVDRDTRPYHYARRHVDGQYEKVPDTGVHAFTTASGLI